MRNYYSNQKKIKNHYKTRAGYALLFSVIFSSLMLFMALGIMHILRKEIILSAQGRESQSAFYAADAGMECALFWDLKHPSPPAVLRPDTVAPFEPMTMSVFPTSTRTCATLGPDPGMPVAGACNRPSSELLVCDGILLRQEIWSLPGTSTPTNIRGPNYAITHFHLDFPDGRCATVEVAKEDPDNSSGRMTANTGTAEGNTRITSRGYNTPCGVTNPRRVERGLRYIDCVETGGIRIPECS